MHEEMVQESVPSTQTPRRRVLATGYWVLICCSANVGSLPLECQISAAGHARPGLRAAGDGPLCPAGSHALHAPVGVRASRDAMPSCDGAVAAAPSRITPSRSLRNLVSSQP